MDQSMSKTFYAPESPYPNPNPIKAVTNQVKNMFSTVSNVVIGNAQKGYPSKGDLVEVCDEEEPAEWELGVVESINKGVVMVRKHGWDEAFEWHAWRFPQDNDDVSSNSSVNKKTVPIVVRCLLHEDALKKPDNNLTDIGFDVECDRSLPVCQCHGRIVMF